MSTKLTPKEESFAVGVASGLSYSAAYRQAYPKSLNWLDSTVWSKASTIAAKGKVRARIDELASKAAKANEVTVERVLAALADLAFFDIRKLVGDDGRPLRLKDVDDRTARAIAGVDVVSIGTAEVGLGEVVKLKLTDRRAALELLGKHLKMFTERLEVDGIADVAKAIAQARGRTRRK